MANQRLIQRFTADGGITRQLIYEAVQAHPGRGTADRQALKDAELTQPSLHHRKKENIANMVMSIEIQCRIILKKT